MKQENLNYRWSDSWVLLAVALASKKHPAELVDIISCGDGINHAIFDESELGAGLFRLSQGKWIVNTDKLFSVTSRYKSEIQPKLTGSIQKQCEIINDCLGAEKWTRGEPIPHPSNQIDHSQFSSEQFRKACDEYLASKRGIRNG